MDLAKKAMQMDLEQAHRMAAADLRAVAYKLAQLAQDIKNPANADRVTADLVNVSTSITMATRFASKVAALNAAIAAIEEDA